MNHHILLLEQTIKHYSICSLKVTTLCIKKIFSKLLCHNNIKGEYKWFFQWPFEDSYLRKLGENNSHRSRVTLMDGKTTEDSLGR